MGAAAALLMVSGAGGMPLPAAADAVILECVVNGTPATPSFRIGFCEEAARGLAAHTGRAVVAIEAREGDSDEAAPYVRFEADIVSQRSAQGTAMWGHIERGTVHTVGQSDTLSAGANDSNLNEGTGRLLAEVLLRAVPTEF
jgi:hypothetical protein